MGLSRRAYAKHRGCAESAVRKALKEGRIELEPDGTIDPAKTDRQWAKNSAGSAPARKRPAKKKAAAKRKTKARKPAAMKQDAPADEPGQEDLEPVADEALESVQKTLREAGEGSGNEKVTLTDARTAKTIVETHLARLKAERERGVLVERKQVADFVFNWMRQERDAWQAWPARVAAQMAAELGVEHRDLLLILETHVREHLEELADIEPPEFAQQPE